MGDRIRGGTPMSPPANVGREVSIEKEWTPLEALGVALRAVTEAQAHLSYAASRETCLQMVKAKLAEQFVKEGVKP